MPDQLSSWPNLSTICKVLHMNVDDVRPLLQNHGIYAGPTDRLPFQVVADIVAASDLRPVVQIPA
jgi:hypothetical protein